MQRSSAHLQRNMQPDRKRNSEHKTAAPLVGPEHRHSASTGKESASHDGLSASVVTGSIMAGNEGNKAATIPASALDMSRGDSRQAHKRCRPAAIKAPQFRQSFRQPADQIKGDSIKTSKASGNSMSRDQCIGAPSGAFIRYCVVSNQLCPFRKSRTAPSATGRPGPSPKAL